MRGLLTNRSVLRISGDEARGFLQGLVTQDVLHVKENEGVFAALLTPQGKILFDFLLTPAGDGFFLDCDAPSADALLKRLTMYKLRAKIAVALEPDLAVAVGELRNPVAAFADPRLDVFPNRAIVKREGVPVADADYEKTRLALGVPEFGRDFSGEEVFLLDVNYDALNAVSYKKGCFVGQEVTSRMKRKTEIRKRTLIADLDGPPPARGAKIDAGDISIGEILSGCAGRALALVRIDRLEEATRAGHVPAADGRPLQLTFPAYLKSG